MGRPISFFTHVGSWKKYIYVQNYIVRSAKGRVMYPIQPQYVGLISMVTYFITITLPLLLLLSKLVIRAESSALE